MTSTLSLRAVCCVMALLLSASGCGDYSGFSLNLGCGLVDFGNSFGGALGSALGAPSWKSLRDDEGKLVAGVEGRCVIDGCEPRIAQIGTEIELRVDVNALAAARKISPVTARAALVSTDSEVIAVDDGNAMPDPCKTDSFFIKTNVTFTQEGQAALVVQHGDDELARFSFEVAQAAELQVTAQPGTAPSSLQIDGTEAGTRSVRGAIKVGVALRVQAHAPDGRVMLIDDVRSTIDDPSVAHFVLSNQPEATSGVRLFVAFVAEGSTTLRTELGELTTLIELHTDPSLPSPQPAAAGSSP